MTEKTEDMAPRLKSEARPTAAPPIKWKEARSTAARSTRDQKEYIKWLKKFILKKIKKFESKCKNFIPQSVYLTERQKQKKKHSGMQPWMRLKDAEREGDRSASAVL